jgi:UDP-glucose:glycoprotein glucosyltransferase
MVVSRAFESGDPSTALYHVAILLDPLSEAAQKWSSLLGVCATTAT